MFAPFSFYLELDSLCPQMSLKKAISDFKLFIFQIQVFSSTTSQLKRTITRFKSSACCGKFRKDGKLIVSGFEDGGVKVR